jgi:hypothetical protein
VVSAASSLRARRWDALVLGGALPGLVAAVRLARAGQRVLVVEEEAALRSPELLREPFALPGPAEGSVLDACLQALGLPLIERRAFETRALSHQVILPEARIDIGGAVATAEEWVAWGLARPGEAQALARGLEEAARAEAQALRTAPLVRRARRAGAPRRAERNPVPDPAPPGEARRHLRGLPEAAASPPAALALVFEAQLRAFSRLAAARPSPEARARLLGAPLTGGGTFHVEDLGLRGLLRERLRGLHGEFRTVGSPFELVEVGHHPGIARRGPDDAWLGRVMLVNVPPARLAAAFAHWQVPVPRFLAAPTPTHRRLAVHLRAAAEVVPEALAPRAILVHDVADPAGPGTVALSVHPSPRGARFRELVARAVVPDEPGGLEAAAARAERITAALMPFSEGRLVRGPLAPVPLWDDDAALVDPEPGTGWPAEAGVRRAARSPVFVVPRASVAALGVEGDLVLGWRMGDALRELLA